jgi:peptidylprolyl isomerase
MTRDKLIAGGMFAIGALVLVGVYFETLPSDEPQPQPQPEVALEESADQPGPYLDIVVEGEGASGTITIDLMQQLAPEHVERVMTLARQGLYDDVVFHRVIEGFMAQSGDVEFGKIGGDLQMAGRGGSDLPDLPAEFSDLPFSRGILGMARAQSPDSANSQFFIMFAPAPSLDGQYTVLGEVIEGMEVVDAIKRGEGSNGAVLGQPDRMARVTVRSN